MSKKTKIILAVLVGVLVVSGICLYPMGKKYFLRNDYKQYLSGSAEFEQGTAFAPLKEQKASVAGMVLAAENKNFKLYTNTETAEVALYDKRSKEIYYTDIKVSVMAMPTKLNEILKNAITHGICL